MSFFIKIKVNVFYININEAFGVLKYENSYINPKSA